MLVIYLVSYDCCGVILRIIIECMKLGSLLVVFLEGYSCTFVSWSSPYRKGWWCTYFIMRLYDKYLYMHGKSLHGKWAHRPCEEFDIYIGSEKQRIESCKSRNHYVVFIIFIWIRWGIFFIKIFYLFKISWIMIV